MKSSFNKKILFSIFTVSVSLFASPANAQNGEVIQIGGLENLLWSGVKTVQFYTLPIMALVLAVLGVKMAMSGDDHQAKSDLKGAMFKIIIGGFIVFSATSIAQVLKNFLS